MRRHRPSRRGSCCGGAAAATLATQHGRAALRQPGDAGAAAPDLSPLLLLSSLSEHTRHLRAEPRCALLVQGAPESANPQTAPRVTLTGLAEPVPEAEVPPLKARWLARHPYAALYADFGDFALWRIRPGGALLVGGFARADPARGWPTCCPTPRRWRRSPRPRPTSSTM